MAVFENGRKKRRRLAAVFLTVSVLAAGCGQGEAIKEETRAEKSLKARGERVTDGAGWYLWDEDGRPVRDGRDAAGENAAVSSGKYEASLAGMEILKAGGNAVDAAVAVSFALGVAEPNASGIGGGGFMLIRRENGETVFLDFRETAPALAETELFGPGENLSGGKSVGVPGTVKGMEYAFLHYGSGNVTWEEVLEPAIRLAEEGFLVTPSLAADMADSLEKAVRFSEFGELYGKSGGSFYTAGERFQNPELAETLRLIAKEGAEAFYRGELAEKIVEAAAEYGGFLTMEDMAGYETAVSQPVRGTYRGYQILSAPLPSSGGIHVIEALNILENFDIRAMGFDSAERLYAFAETFNLCFHDRETFLGDPDYTEVPEDGLLSKERARLLAEQIVFGEPAEYEPVSPWQYEHEDTTHFSVADKGGSLAAVTQTVNGIFGSGVVPEGCGFVLNNEMEDFSLEPGSPNEIAGGKKPLSSMSPTFVLREDGSPFLVLGSPGATKIITALVQVISNVIDLDMELQEAVDAPRFHSEAGEILCEPGLYSAAERAMEGTEKALRKAGEFDRSLGAVNGVLFGEDGLLYGAADPRRDGKALGD